LKVGEIIPLDIELHFMDNDELPTEKRVDHEVRIVHSKNDGEFFFEDGIGEDKGYTIINAGGLKLKVLSQNFNIAYIDYLTNQITNRKI